MTHAELFCIDNKFFFYNTIRILSSIMIEYCYVMNDH